MIFFGELILKTRFSITIFFLGNEAKFVLRVFYYNALGAFFEALIQRTDGCTHLLWLLVSHRQNIAQNNRDSTFQAFKYSIACKLELFDIIKPHEVVVSRFIFDQKHPL